jgi:hypothetical protein
MAHPPGSGSGSNSHWPLAPHAGNYKERLAKMDEDAKEHPRKKSWLKEKLNLTDSTDPEYYDRRFTASGNGSDYEQISQAITGGYISKLALFPRVHKQEEEESVAPKAK